MSAASDPLAAFTIHQATAAGMGGIAIIELYGPGARCALERCFRPRHGRLPDSGEIRFGALVDENGRPVDDVLVAPIVSSGSWCGLAGWSVSCHGGAVITEEVLAVFARLGGVDRPVSAILNSSPQSGGLDLIRRQAFEQLIQACTERAAAYFLRQYQGELGNCLGEMVQACAQNRLSIPRLLEGIGRMIDQAPQAIRLGEPLRVLLAGRTNAGKSALFNSLLGKERVIVSPLAGTTRDRIEETIEIAGYPVVLIDSAGLRSQEPDDAIEGLGIQLTLSATCDAVLFLTDHGGPLFKEEKRFLEKMAPGAVLRIRTKADLAVPEPEPEQKPKLAAGPAIPQVALSISVQSGEGLPQLRELIRGQWLGPLEGIELPPLPFTGDLKRRLERWRECLAAEKWQNMHIDALREGFIQCLGMKI